MFLFPLSLSLVFKYILVLVLLLVVGLRLITGKLGIQVDILRFFVLGLEKGSCVVNCLNMLLILMC